MQGALDIARWVSSTAELFDIRALVFDSLARKFVPSV